MSNVPLRILKEEKAPLIYIKDWRDLRSVLSNEMKLSIEEKIKRRKELMLWYENFKSKMILFAFAFYIVRVPQLHIEE
jgi:hypothetical protein